MDQGPSLERDRNYLFTRKQPKKPIVQIKRRIIKVLYRTNLKSYRITVIHTYPLPHRGESPSDYASSSSTSSIVGPFREAGLDVSLSLVPPPLEGFGTASVAWPSGLGVFVPEDWPDLDRLEDFSDFSDFFFFFVLMSQSHPGTKESTWGMCGVRNQSECKRGGGGCKEEDEYLRIRHLQTGWGISKYPAKQPPW